MALDDDEKRKRYLASQKKYRSSQKFKDTRKKYERSDYFREAKRKLAQRTRGDEYLEYQFYYRKSDEYRESIKKYRESEKYQNWLDSKKHYCTEHVDDGNNNTVIRSYKQTKNEQNEMNTTLNDELLNDLCDEWLDWLDNATYINDSGCVVFRKEIPRTTYFQFLHHYKTKTGTRISLTALENEYQENEMFFERMSEIDLIYENLLEMYMTNGKINALASKFMFTNKYKEKWADVKKNVNETSISQLVSFKESIYQLPLKQQTFELPKHIDYDDYDDINEEKND